MFSFEGERVRFCSGCNRNVYNLSAMTQREAAALVYKTEGRLCVRFYRRADGTLLTQDCPVGLRALKRRVAWVAQLLFGMLLSSLAGLGFIAFEPLRWLAAPVAPRPVVMGGLMPHMEEKAGLPILPVEQKKPTRR